MYSIMSACIIVALRSSYADRIVGRVNKRRIVFF